MKKVLTTVSLILAIFILAGCSQAAVVATITPTPTAAPTPTPNPADFFMLPDWVVFGMSAQEIESHYSQSPDGTALSLGSVKYYYNYKGYDQNYINCHVLYFMNIKYHKLYDVNFNIDFDPSFNCDDTSISKKPILEEFDYIKALLTTAYGKPTKSVVQWSDKKYKNDKSMLSYAIVTGDCKYITLWRYKGYYVYLYTANDLLCVSYADVKQFDI